MRVLAALPAMISVGWSPTNIASSGSTPSIERAISTWAGLGFTRSVSSRCNYGIDASLYVRKNRFDRLKSVTRHDAERAHTSPAECGKHTPRVRVGIVTLQCLHFECAQSFEGLAPESSSFFFKPSFDSVDQLERVKIHEASLSLPGLYRVPGYPLYFDSHVVKVERKRGERAVEIEDYRFNHDALPFPHAHSLSSFEPAEAAEKARREFSFCLMRERTAHQANLHRSARAPNGLLTKPSLICHTDMAHAGYVKKTTRREP